MVHDQAPEGRQRRQARRRLHEGRARDQRSPPGRAAATPTPTTGCGSRSRRRARSTCPPTTSSGRSTRRPARARRTSTRRSSTRATAPAAWRSSSRPRPTTATGPRPRSARCSRSPAAQLAGSGAVAWQFEPRGLISVPKAGQDPDEVALAAIDAGAEDVDTDDEESIEIYTSPAELRGRAPGASRARACRSTRPSPTMIAKQTVELDSSQGAPGAPPHRAARGPRRRPAGDRQLRHPRGRLRRGRRVRRDRPRDRPRDRRAGLRDRRARRRPAPRGRPRLPRHDAPTCRLPRAAAAIHSPVDGADRAPTSRTWSPSSGSSSRATSRRPSRSARPAASCCWPPRSTGCRSARRPRARSRSRSRATARPTRRRSRGWSSWSSA